MELKPVGREKLYLGILEQLENQILNGGIKIGESLPSEDELASTFLVGKRPVREALQILEAKGLIKRPQGRRAQVIRRDVDVFIDSLSKSIKQLFSGNKEYFIQLMQVRQIVELQAVELLAASDRRNDMDALEKGLEKMHTAVETNDVALLGEGDVLFHKGLVAGLENKILSTIYDKLYGFINDEIIITTKLYITELNITDVRKTYLEHLNIRNSIKSSDIEGSKKLIARHLETSMKNLRAVLSTTA
jgi:GntR family transcriptional regulator, transcriptional repressor for pyruvate dehydrogenase complex